MKAHSILFGFGILVIGHLFFSTAAHADCRPISTGEFDGIFRVIFNCDSDFAVQQLDVLYPNACTELGSKEVESGIRIIACCNFIDETEYQASVDSTYNTGASTGAGGATSPNKKGDGAQVYKDTETGVR